MRWAMLCIGVPMACEVDGPRFVPPEGARVATLELGAGSSERLRQAANFGELRIPRDPGSLTAAIPTERLDDCYRSSGGGFPDPGSVGPSVPLDDDQLGAVEAWLWINDERVALEPSNRVAGSTPSNPAYSRFSIEDFEPSGATLGMGWVPAEHVGDMLGFNEREVIEVPRKLTVDDVRSERNGDLELRWSSRSDGAIDVFVWQFFGAGAPAPVRCTLRDDGRHTISAELLEAFDGDTTVELNRFFRQFLTVGDGQHVQVEYADFVLTNVML